MTGAAAEKIEGKAVEIKKDLRSILDAKSISKFLFIDDAFDDLADLELLDAERDEIWASIAADDAYVAAALEHGIEAPDDINAGLVGSLLESDGPLKDLLELSPFVIEYRSKYQNLEPAIEGLRALGRTVETAGRNDWHEKTDGVDVVFLDWFFGTDGRNEAIERASRTARALHDLQQKPLIVLISSNTSVQAESAGFREASALIPGLFDAIPKNWLADSYGLHLHMTAFAEIFQKGHVVQRFVDQLEDKTASAITTFRETVRSLTLSDYANLQDFSLRADGHPLGDYLMELLAGLWSDSLFRDQLKTNISQLNREDFSSLPTFETPSRGLAHLYNSAVFDMHVGNFDYHPHYSENGTDKRLQLSLGDIVVEEAEGKPSRAYIVMNPECDLSSSPRSSRRIPDDQSILLLPGELVAVDHAERSKRKELPDTPYFILGGPHPYRIHWHTTGMQAVPFRDFETWLGGKTRRARMRALHVLSLQQAVHAHLMRVGLPSPPPIYRSLSATVRKVSRMKFVGEDTILTQGEFVIPRESGEDKIAFTKTFLVELKHLVATALEDFVDAAKNKEKAREMKAEIESALLDPKSWGELLVPFKLGSSIRKFLGDTLLVYREENAPKESQLSGKTLVCVSLRHPEATD